MYFSVLKLVGFSCLLRRTVLMLVLVQLKMLVIAYLVIISIAHASCRIKMHPCELMQRVETLSAGLEFVLQELTVKGVGVVLGMRIASLVDAMHMQDLLFITLKV